MKLLRVFIAAFIAVSMAFAAPLSSKPASGVGIEPKSAVYNCETKRTWDSAEQSYVYQFTCDVFSADDPKATPSPTASELSGSPSPSPTAVFPSVSVEPSLTKLPAEPVPLPTPDVTDLTPEPAPSNVIDNPSISRDDQVIIEQATEDGVLTDDEKVKVADILVESFTDAPAIPSDVLQDSGLDYEDLPPEQPVSLDNGVVITASVADAIQIFDTPSDVFTTVLVDPKKAFKAISNVGADLPKKVRKKSQQVVFPVIIVGSVITSATLGIIKIRR